jgi:CRISPR/Cas system-associated exonuclease Cas4 (RecB family)
MKKSTTSFSALMNFERCPLSVTFPYVETTAPAALRGIESHTNIETYLKGQTEVNPFPDLPLEELADSAPTVEEEWALSQDWQPADRGTTWLRVKPDAVIVAPSYVLIIDFKTGKREGNEVKHTQQLQFYLCAASALYPERKSYRGEDWYIDLPKDKNIYSTRDYSEEQLKPLRERWHKRALAMTTTEDFPAKPSKSNCRFCSANDRCEFAYEVV